MSQRTAWIALGAVAALTVGGAAVLHLPAVGDALHRALAWALDAAAAHPVLVGGTLWAALALSMAAALPTKAVLTVAAGAALGTGVGMVLVLSAVLTGTSLLFGVVRRWRKRRSAAAHLGRFEPIARRMERHPIATIAALRLIVTVPYAPITAWAALRDIPFGAFALGSAIGDLPVVWLYAAAGDALQDLYRHQATIDWVQAAVLCAAGVVFLVTTAWPRSPKETQ